MLILYALFVLASTASIAAAGGKRRPRAVALGIAASLLCAVMFVLGLALFAATWDEPEHRGELWLSLFTAASTVGAMSLLGGLWLPERARTHGLRIVGWALLAIATFIPATTVLIPLVGAIAAVVLPRRAHTSRGDHPISAAAAAESLDGSK